MIKENRKPVNQVTPVNKGVFKGERSPGRNDATGLCTLHFRKD
jgi:hypothetical protein